MDRIISAKELRAALPDILRRTKRGERFLVLYRSRLAFRIVPVDQDHVSQLVPLETDPLFRADAVGKSSDGFSASNHDRILYPV
jgi:antitoxin (DNA-binding transcriptional repressor) of toxin-antitoxin stability system